MSDRPIVLTADEVRETLAGRMSHILRPVNPQPLIGDSGVWYPKAPLQPFGGGRERHYAHEAHMRKGLHIDFGPCASGDKLWVRETWGSKQADHPRAVDGRPPKPGDSLVYQADPGDAWQWRSAREGGSPGGFVWRSSTSMPRWASRLSLDVVAVRVARLDEITDEQIMSAGVPLAQDMRCGGGYPGGAHSYQDHSEIVRCPICNGLGYESRTLRDALRTCWNLRHRWQVPASSNPWIWDITVKRVED